MYPRWVPPKKDGKSKTAAAAEPAPTPMPKKIVFDDEDDAPATSYQPALLRAEDDVESDAAKRKRKRKHKRTETEDEVIERAEDVAGEKNEKNEKKEKKGRKREKKEKQKSQGEPETDRAEDTIMATLPLRTEGKQKNKEKAKEDDQAGHPEELSFRHKALLEKREKSLQRAQVLAKKAASQPEPEVQPNEEKPTATELHGLQPLPQPAPVEQGAAKPSYETLPSWLANPVRVRADARARFSSLGLGEKLGRPELGIHPATEQVLKTSGGWAEAFAVQAAVIPRLLPSRESRRGGDLLVSAATGSGKTLAYLLPLVRDVSRTRTAGMPRLQAVVVVPTRELVQQAHEMCMTCVRALAAAPGSRRVRVAVAVGSQSFKKEQAALMKEELIYDPAGYHAELRRRLRQPFDLDDENDDDDNNAIKMAGFDTSRVPIPDHVVGHVSSADVLICTPGRLVMHIKSTPGFTLDYVRWLVVDEADKLLGQSYQKWLEVVMGQLHRPEQARLLGARDFPDTAESGVRKIILSATMTRDLSVIDSLKLRRAQHIVLEDGGADDNDKGGANDKSGTDDKGGVNDKSGTDDKGGVNDKSGTDDKGGANDKIGTDHKGGTDYMLPERLQESAVKVRDESQKPLYLVDLLRTVMGASTSSTSSENGDDSKDEKDTKKSASVLVFAKSNENALRLARLLSLLAPAWLSRGVGTITSTTRTSARRQTLREFKAGKLRVLVATDLAARGIDLPHLGHVVNYDMPPSVEFYVHRVGRTARAGRDGHAWTLFTKKEAGWFWPAIAGQGGRAGQVCAVQRAHKVAKAQSAAHDGDGRFSEARLAAYEAALAQLGQEAAEGQ